jgi:hypothetical protein
METLIILVALATVFVPILAEVAAARVLVAGEPTRRQDAICCF